MPGNKLVSILMPAYNAEKFINQAIESILNQTYPYFELLIADDASKDKTKKIIESYNDQRIKTFHNNENLGYLRTFNKLIEFTKGDFITFQDADDYARTDRIELLLKQFENDEELGCCGSNFTFVTETGELEKSSSYPLNYEDILKYFSEEMPFCGSAVMIKREVYKKVGGYNLFFDRVGEEDHYWLYLICSYFKAANIPDCLYFYRHNMMSVSRHITSPIRLHIKQIINHIKEQRSKTGTDDLEQNNIKAINAFMEKILKPYENDNSMLNYVLAKRYYYEGRKKDALAEIRLAILKKPFRLNYYRDYIYFVLHKPEL